MAKNNTELFGKEKVHVDIISSAGHTEYEGASDAAVTEIRRYVQKDGKWLYLDGDYTDADTLTAQDLEEAEDITLTNALAGGQ